MSALDIEALLAPIGDDNPTGDDLEYDADFMELDRIAQGTPERVMGDQVIEAEPPDWGDVEERAQALLGRSKDLRTAVHLTRAALARYGLVGLADGLDIIAQLLERFWEGVHPRLDPDDDNDPTLRVNCLLPLADRAGLVATIRATPIVSAPRLGRFSYRDYQIAKGELPAPQNAEAPPPDLAQFEGAFEEVSLESLAETSAAAERALACIKSIEAVVSDKVGATYAPDLEALTRTLRDVSGLLVDRLARRGVGEVATQVDANAADDSGTSSTGPRAAAGEIATRDDVVAALERVCAYYKRYEPSSPVPLILRRAQRLARMDFLEILRDMAPSGVAEAELIGGVMPPQE